MFSPARAYSIYLAARERAKGRRGGSPEARFERGGWHALEGPTETTGASLPALSGDQIDTNAG